MAVLDKLQKVQSKLNVPKNQFNKFGGFYYRSCEDIMEAVKPILAEVGAVLTVSDELMLVGERYYIKATACFRDIETNESIRNEAYAREPASKKGMDESQVTGATSTYARKYALNGLFCLDDVKDADDPMNYKPKTSKGKTADPEPEAEESNLVSQPMINSINSLVEKHSSKGLKVEKILSQYGITDLKEMTIDQYQDCMKKLELYDKEEKA